MKKPKIIAYNKVLYKEVILKVTPELIQDAHHGITITENEFIQHLEQLYQKEIQQIRNNKLIQIGI